MRQDLAPAPIVFTVPCPRCKEPLIDPRGLGWCKKCGYCRSLAETDAQPAKSAAEPTTLNATGSAISQTPTWVWVTLFGIAIVAGATFVGGRYLTLSPLERALLTTVQIALGIAAMIFGQFIGLMRIAPEESVLGFWDAIFPFRLYGMIFKRLPATRHTIYLGAWGLAGAVSALIFVGGLGHWFSYLPNSKNPPKAAEKAKK
jgi:hypothetical protein